MSHKNDLHILQYNTIKSKNLVMATLLRDPKIHEYDILALQEPWRNPIIPTTHNPISDTFHLCFPKDNKEMPARVCFFVNKRIDPNDWIYKDHSRDLGTLEIITKPPGTDEATKIILHNIYNPPNSSINRTSCLPLLKTTLTKYQDEEQIIVGDFNLHHEYWGGPKIRISEPESEDLIEIIEETQLASLLPSATVTYDDKNTQSCIDLCYGTQNIADRVIKCSVDYDMDHNSDHLPITTILDLRIAQRLQRNMYDWPNVDIQKLRANLTHNLPVLRSPRTETALDRYVEEVVKALQLAIDQAIPLKRWSPRARAGWTLECKELQAEARRLKRQNSRNHTEQSWEAYRKARNEKGRVIRQALLQGHREQVEKATENPESMWKLAKWARNRGEIAATTTPVLKDPNSDIEYTKAQDKAKLFRKAFFPAPPEPDLQDINEANDLTHIPFPDIKDKEIYLAIKSTPPFKAAGPDGIINQVLHITASQMAPHLTRIFNTSLKLGYCPAHFRQSTTTVIKKPGKSDYTIPKAYRPIALLNTIGKIMDAIIAKRISYITEKHQLLPETHIGGRKGRSTEHALHAIIEKIYESWNAPRSQIASLLLLDVSGAFDNVSHDRLVHNLRKRRVDKRTVKWITSFLTDRSTSIHFDSFRSETYETKTGIPQGSPLSPILYLFYNADLIEICNQEPNILATGYIDDIAILRWGNSIEENCRGLERTMQQANVWAKKHASVFDPGKFQLTHHTRKRLATELDHGIQMEQTTIYPSPSCKYLGITMDTELNWKQHIQKLKLKVSRSIGALSSLAGSTWGAKVTELRRIYQAVVIPQMMYGCSIWSIAQEQREGYTQQTLNSLTALQAKAARTISGAFKSTSIPALNIELHLLPIEQQIWKTNRETVSRILSTEKISALMGFRTIRNRRSRGRKKPYQSPLEHTFKRLRHRRGPTIDYQETIPPYLVPPWWRGPNTRIAINKDIAKTQHKEFLKNTSNSIFIYTDGSGIENHIGAAAVSPLTRNTRRIYMGDSETSTVYVAEVQGIVSALEMVTEDAEKGNRRKRAVVFTDNQAAIRTFQMPTGRSGAYIIARAISLIDKIQQDLELEIELRWIPAHIGLCGNEAADRAAKEAAKQTLHTHNSEITQAKTYHLQTTLKTWLHRWIRAEWAYNWEMEFKGRTTYKYTPEPNRRILQLHYKLKKWQSAMLVQMRTGKIGLRDYLWKRKVPDFNHPGCECGEGRQTVEHILLRCRDFNDLRKGLFNGKRQTDSRAILSNPKLATKAIKFMEQTQLLGQLRMCEAA